MRLFFYWVQVEGRLSALQRRAPCNGVPGSQVSEGWRASQRNSNRRTRAALSC